MINTRNNLGSRGLGDRRSLVVGLALAVVAIALLATEAFAQTAAEPFEVVGSVVDAENGQALIGAWVAIEGSDWGSVTDDRGRFRIPDMTEGTLSLTVEQLGYETLTWQGDVRAGVPLALRAEPEPMVLEGLQVVTDRFETRRRAVATSVFAFGPKELSTTSQRTALEFVEVRSGASSVRCNGRRGDTCLYVRGRVVEPVVYLDEMPVLGGLEYLDAFRPHELYMVELYSGGRHIRAYTPRFMERAAKSRLTPIALLF